MRRAKEYNFGDRIHCVGEIKTAAGQLATPSASEGWYRKPSASLVTTPLTLVSGGIYSFDIDGDESGTYYYGFVATGTIMAASPDGSFIVLPSVRQ